MPRRSYTTEVSTAIRVAVDIVLLNAALCSAYWLRFHSPLTNFIPIYKGIPPFEFYLKAFPVATVVFLYMFKLFHSYAKRWRYDAPNEFFMVTKGVVAGMIALMAMTFLLPSTHSPGGLKYSRMTFAMVFPLIELYVTLGRLLANAVEKKLYRVSKEKRKILIIGTGETSARIARHVRRNPSLECQIVGFLKCAGERGSSSKIISPVIGMAEEFPGIISRLDIDEVFLTTPGLEHKKLMDIINTCEKNLVEFKHVPDMFELMTRHVDVVNLDGVPLLGIHHTPLRSPWNRFLKRCLDIAGSTTGLIVTSPILALSAIAVKLNSKGPVFYRQERCGEDGRRFYLYKLRTMIHDAERDTGPIWAKEDDPRCTRVGAFLRRHNLDELPQLYNVLCGNMSLVGPRPERPHFVRHFAENMPHYMSRHLVRSGLTGWAQVNGLRGDTSVKARLRYDMYYLENWSLLFDLKVILMTIFARRNAY